jgi:hypothetical protein
MYFDPGQSFFAGSFSKQHQFKKFRGATGPGANKAEGFRNELTILSTL